MCDCICVEKDFLIQGLVSHGLVVVDSVVLKIYDVLPSDIIQSVCGYLNKTLPDLTPLQWGSFRFLTSLDILTSPSFAF